MTKWIQENTSYARKVGLFTLCVWPLSATEKYPYQAWVKLVEDGSSGCLPSSSRAKVKLGSLEEAKQWIEDAMRLMCQNVVDELR